MIHSGLLFFLIGFLIIAIWTLIGDWFAPRFSPMGPWPSKAEEYAQKKLDKTAEYKIRSNGIVQVKNYRWFSELESLIERGKPRTTPMKHYIKYRRDKLNPEWYPYEEKVGEDGVWDYIGSVSHRIEEF